MKFSRLVVAAITVLSVGFMASPSNAEWKNPKTNLQANREVCSGHKWWTGTYSHKIWAVKQMVQCESDLFGVDTPTAMRVADCESNFEYWQTYGQFAGVYQHGRTWWASRQNTYAPNFPESVFNPRTNIVVTMKMVKAGGWGPWSCY